MFCVTCGLKIKIDPEKEKSMCKKCSAMADKVNQPAKKFMESRYKIIDESDTKMFGGYLSKLYSMCQHLQEPMTMDEWINAIGEDKTADAISFGLLVQEEVEHDEEIITEKPADDKPVDDDMANDDEEQPFEGEMEDNADKNYNLGDIKSHNKCMDGNCFEMSVSAEISDGDKKGTIRYHAYGDSKDNIKHEDWSTDNIDMFDVPFECVLNSLREKLHEQNDNFGEDNGPLKYHLHIKCPHA